MIGYHPKKRHQSSALSTRDRVTVNDPKPTTTTTYDLTRREDLKSDDRRVVSIKEGKKIMTTA